MPPTRDATVVLRDVDVRELLRMLGESGDGGTFFDVGVEGVVHEPDARVVGPPDKGHPLFDRIEHVRLEAIEWLQHKCHPGLGTVVGSGPQSVRSVSQLVLGGTLPVKKPRGA